MGWFGNVTMRVGFPCVAILIAAATRANAAAEPAADGETRLESRDSRPVWLQPAVSLTRSSFAYDAACGCSGAAPLDAVIGTELVTGLELGAALMAPSDRDRRFSIGFDFRQAFARADGRTGLDILATKLGIRMELSPKWAKRSSIGAAWFFGDTIVIRHHDRQYNGHTLAVFAVYDAGAMRWLIEASGAVHREGPGFISLSRRAGDETLTSRTLKLAAEFPFDVPMPNWLVTFPRETAKLDDHVAP